MMELLMLILKYIIIFCTALIALNLFHIQWSSSPRSKNGRPFFVYPEHSNFCGPLHNCPGSKLGFQHADWSWIVFKETSLFMECTYKFHSSVDGRPSWHWSTILGRCFSKRFSAPSLIYFLPLKSRLSWLNLMWKCRKSGQACLLGQHCHQQPRVPCDSKCSTGAHFFCFTFKQRYNTSGHWTTKGTAGTTRSGSAALLREDFPDLWRPVTSTPFGACLGNSTCK